MNLSLTKKTFLYSVLVLTVFTMVGCANKYQTEKQSVLDFSQSYYQRWTAGVKGGGSGINIFLTLKPDVNLEDKNIQVEGIYFKEFYTELQFYPPAKFQGAIKTKGNSKDSFELLQGGSANNESQEDTEKKVEILFQLENNEAVISYKEKGIQKYFKITLVKKDMMSQPM
jgi:hypothetical protein